MSWRPARLTTSIRYTPLFSRTPPMDNLIYYQNGQCGFVGALLELNRNLDGLFLSWAERWRAWEMCFPIFIPAAELARIDYLSSFPHLATFPVSMQPDEDNLKSFIHKIKESPADAVPLTRASLIRDLLTPAA